MRLLGALAAAAAALAAAGVAWRWLSRRQSRPCPAWLAFHPDGGFTDWLARTRETLDRIGLHPGQRLLEVGPGTGRLLIPAARRLLPGGAAFGLDIQPKMIARLASEAARAGLTNLAAVLGDATLPHFAPDSFDLVCLCTVLGEIPGREAALRECYAALKPGGTLSITEILPDPHYQSRATVERLAEAAGFRMSAVHGRWYHFTANFRKPAPQAGA